MTKSSISDRTNAYPIVPASVVASLAKKVLDVATGGMRNRHLACFLSVAVIRDFEGHQDPIILQGDMPKILVDADNIEDLKARVYEELETVFENSRKIISGEITMEDLEREAEEARKEIEAELRASMESDVPPSALSEVIGANDVAEVVESETVSVKESTT